MCTDNRKLALVTSFDESTNLNDCCRICLQQNDEMTEIFGDSVDYTVKIAFCTGLELKNSVNIPTKICKECEEDLLAAHRFKTQALLSDQTLNGIVLKPEIKCEYPKSEYGDDFVVDDSDDDGLSIKKEVLDADVCDKIGLQDFKLKQNTVKKRGKYKKKGDTTPRTKKCKFRRLYCEMCDVKFSSREESDDHKKRLHKEELWVCEFCGKFFVHRGSHVTHIRSHQPPQYHCADCPYKATFKNDLIKHIRVHTGLKPYQCQLCPSAYKASSNLQSHIRRKHYGIKNFTCPVCGHQFFDNSKLKRHLDSHNDIKRFSCDICHSLFSRRCTWKKHMLRSHGVSVPRPTPGRQRAFPCYEGVVKGC